MTKSKIRKLNNRGNILVLSCFAVVLIAMLALVGYSFSGIYFEHNRLQASADEIALTGAKKLNDRDRIGQLNNMISRSRQLVYSDREDSKDVKTNFQEIQKLSDQLLDESRQAAQDLDTERKKVRTLAESEAVQAMRDKFNSIKQSYAMTLPWMRVRTPRVIGVGLGTIDGVESNVQEFDQFEQLKDSDRSQGYVAQYAKLNLYKSNQNEQLKDDSDLPFNLTSLPAPLKSEVSPTQDCQSGRLSGSRGRADSKRDPGNSRSASGKRHRTKFRWNDDSYQHRDYNRSIRSRLSYTSDCEGVAPAPIRQSLVRLLPS